MADNGRVRITFVLVMLSLFHGYYTLEKGIFSRDHSHGKEYVKLMTKHAVMSIKTEYGDIYDCVDMYKQPAFDHPLLKNHTLQIEPSSYPNGVRSNKGHGDSQNIELNDGGCPNGTVPIQRKLKNDLLLSHPTWGIYPDAYHHYAGVQTLVNKFYGARVFMNVWNPKVDNAMDSSISQISLTAGPYGEKNSIKAGWMVNPRLYGDSRTRLFTLWTADAYRKTGCYNIKCPGFIQVNRRIPVDGSLHPISEYNGQQSYLKIDIVKDPKSGNWFLYKNDRAIGYWPSSLFNHLNIEAERVEWGGEVAQCAGCIGSSMGSGLFPEQGYRKAAYMRGLQVMSDMSMVLKDTNIRYWHISNSSCYRVTFNNMAVGPFKGNHIFYGGPGGKCD